MNWELLPRRGIRIGKTEIIIGAPRAEVRQALSQHFSYPTSPRRPTEDQYERGERKVFMRYDDADTLEEIMCVSGSLCLGELELHETTWTELAARLKACGYTITEPLYYADGQDCQELGINIATRDDLGGDGDEIEWVAMWR
jgi:hypothetical protein